MGILQGHFTDHPEHLHFSKSVAVLTGISFWFGLVVLATGLWGLLPGWLLINQKRRDVAFEHPDRCFGLLMLHLFATMKILTVIFGLWMLETGLSLTQSGWSLKGKNSFGWQWLLPACYQPWRL
jgi:hypothetical protein